ncbi:hypothetical protein DFH09DRAFT_1080196 [Mycena vulgaris]|nr:hypothetical protein DFH09DRAFT_1080196 [Mycena vulgaris]
MAVVPSRPSTSYTVFSGIPGTAPPAPLGFERARRSSQIPRHLGDPLPLDHGPVVPSARTPSHLLPRRRGAAPPGSFPELSGLHYVTILGSPPPLSAAAYPHQRSLSAPQTSTSIQSSRALENAPFTSTWSSLETRLHVKSQFCEFWAESRCKRQGNDMFIFEFHVSAFGGSWLVSYHHGRAEDFPNSTCRDYIAPRDSGKTRIYLPVEITIETYPQSHPEIVVRLRDTLRSP